MNKKLKKQVILGLTGSIGMGKSTVAKHFKRFKTPVFDADEAVHFLLDHHDGVKNKIEEEFPEAVQSGHIDRLKLGDIVYSEENLLKKLEEILHPFVFEQAEKFIQDNTKQGQDFIVLDIPLLFETGFDKRCTHTMVVWSPPDIQEKRVLNRQGMNKDRFKSILHRQLSAEEKKRRADFVLETHLDKSTTFLELVGLLKPLCGR